MLPSNTNVPEVHNAPSWYPWQPVPGLYTTGLCIGSGHETRWYGPTFPVAHPGPGILLWGILSVLTSCTCTNFCGEYSQSEAVN